MSYSRKNLAAALRRTLQNVQGGSEVRPEEPGFVELQRILLLRIAELEEADGLERLAADATGPEPALEEEG